MLHRSRVDEEVVERNNGQGCIEDGNEHSVFFGTRSMDSDTVVGVRGSNIRRLNVVLQKRRAQNGGGRVLKNRPPWCMCW